MPENALMKGTKLAAVCALAAHVGLAQTNQADSVLAFRGVTVIDVVAGRARPAMTVVIRGNRISQVGPSSMTVPENARVISADGKYLIPGLWDMHVHGIGNPGYRDFANPLLIANGVTGARSMGRTTLADILHERDAILRGEVIGPRIVASSLMLDGPYPVWPEAAAVKSPEAARQLVDQQKAGGADFIKIYSLLGRPEFFAVADEAKQQRISFVGHVPAAVKASEASNAGMKSMEHLYGVLEETSSEADELLARDKVNREQYLTARAQGSTEPFLGLLESLRIWYRAALTHEPARADRLYKTLVANGTWQVPTLVVIQALRMTTNRITLGVERIRFFQTTPRLSCAS